MKGSPRAHPGSMDPSTCPRMVPSFCSPYTTDSAPAATITVSASTPEAKAMQGSTRRARGRALRGMSAVVAGAAGTKLGLFFGRVHMLR